MQVTQKLNKNLIFKREFSIFTALKVVFRGLFISDFKSSLINWIKFCFNF